MIYGSVCSGIEAWSHARIARCVQCSDGKKVIHADSSGMSQPMTVGAKHDAILKGVLATAFARNDVVSVTCGLSPSTAHTDVIEQPTHSFHPCAAIGVDDTLREDIRFTLVPRDKPLAVAAIVSKRVHGTWLPRMVALDESPCATFLIKLRKAATTAAFAITYEGKAFPTLILMTLKEFSWFSRGRKRRYLRTTPTFTWLGCQHQVTPSHLRSIINMGAAR